MSNQTLIVDSLKKIGLIQNSKSPNLDNNNNTKVTESYDLNHYNSLFPNTQSNNLSIQISNHINGTYNHTDNGMDQTINQQAINQQRTNQKRMEIQRMEQWNPQLNSQTSLISHPAQTLQTTHPAHPAHPAQTMQPLIPPFSTSTNHTLAMNEEFQTPKPIEGTSAGLSNPVGYNNCFLNVIVQLLFHIPVFRNFFMTIKDHSCSDQDNFNSRSSSCVFCALQILFNNFKYGERNTLDPNQLRESLSRAYEEVGRFQLFQMDDACEAYESLISQLNLSLEKFNIKIKCFDFEIQEFFYCSNCSHKSEPHVYTSNLWYSIADEILDHKRKRPDQSFQDIFRQLSEVDEKTCEVCNLSSKGYKIIDKLPPILCFGFSWTNNSKQQIYDFMNMIPERTNVKEFFRIVNYQNVNSFCRLKGILLYYGQHYECIIYNEQTSTYFLYNDTNVKEIGSYLNVAKKCVDGHLIPVLLLYEVIDNSQMKKDVPIKTEHLTIKTSQNLQNTDSFYPKGEISPLLKNYYSPFMNGNSNISASNKSSPDTKISIGSQIQQKSNQQLQIECILIGTSIHSEFIKRQDNQNEFYQIITLPPNYSKNKVKICILRRDREISDSVGKVSIKIRNVSSTLLFEHGEVLNKHCSSIYLYFPRMLLENDNLQFELIITFKNPN